MNKSYSGQRTAAFVNVRKESALNQATHSLEEV